MVAYAIGAIRKSLGKARGLKVLDAGCAEGRDTYMFSGHGMEPEGMDVDKKFIAQAKKSYPGINFRPGSIEKLPYKTGSFDVVYCVNTIFYTDYRKSVPELERVLKKGGLGIITIDRKIIDLDRGKVIHSSDVDNVLRCLRNSEVLSKKSRTRLDKAPFKHRHYFYIVVFRKD